MSFVRLSHVPLGVTTLCFSKRPKSVNRELKIAQCCVSAEWEASRSANEENLESPDLGLVFESLLQLSPINQAHISLTFLFCEMWIITSHSVWWGSNEKIELKHLAQCMPKML